MIPTLGRKAGMSLARRACRGASAALVVLTIAAATASGASVRQAANPPTLAGTWVRLPAAPLGLVEEPTSVWTGSRMIVFGRVTDSSENGEIVSRLYQAAAYNPTSGSWRRLPGLDSKDAVYGYRAVWTGKEVLLWGQGTHAALDPATGRWRTLPAPPQDGAALVVWTGREMIGWGGGCCGDAWATGAAYDPATNTWRRLPRSPLHGSQAPLGAWTGRELIVFVGGDNPDTGKAWPASLASAAAYDPTSNSWRRIAPLPSPRVGASAIWDGDEVLVVGGGGALHGFAYSPAANRWRQLPHTASRTGAIAAWTGKLLLVWGGRTANGRAIPGQRTAFDPAADHWLLLPPAPIHGRNGATAVWTGKQLIVWGGGDAYPPFTDGAAFTPRTR